MLNETNKYERRIHQLEDELDNFKAAVSELKVLNEIAVAAGAAEDVEETLKLILNKTTGFLNAEHGVILLVSENDEILQTFVKQSKDSKVNKRPHIGEHITGWVLLNKKSLIVKDLSKDDRFKVTKEEIDSIKSIICSPIWFERKIIGILQLINKINDPDNQTSYTDNDLTLLSIISMQAGQLIKNSQLQQLNSDKKQEVEKAKLEAEKFQELDRLKTTFFTNISHEFRTPLTLILGPAEKIISRNSNDVIKDTEIIQRNSRRLLQLVNQLLDLSSLEAGKMKLMVSRNNIVSFIKGIALSFESLSEEKDITLKIFSEKEYIEVYFDREKMIKVLTNILSNAFKFTKQDGRITISIKTKPPFSKAENEERVTPLLKGELKEDFPLPKEELKEGFVEIKIKDNGIGILQEEIPKLFDRFYRADSLFTKESQGTGIGLALTKELVELHHGSINVQSEQGRWTEFILYFPLGKNHLKDEEKAVDENPGKPMDKIIEEDYSFDNISRKDLGNEIEEDSLLQEEKTIILVVEDNYDMREYIKESLGKDYCVEEAVNGEQGIRKAERLIPDLIISDMIMPKMDGNELTRILKNNEKTSHIPIIILTAKSGQENKLEGLETGADDYLIKPFDIKELRVRIKNLINIRQKLQEKFRKTEYSDTKREKGSQTGHLKNLNLKGIDEKFINKILNIIENHISEESFSVEELGNEASMSRAQFYRKIKALTGMSASIYLRTIRLTKAKKMLEEKQANISEIAFSVGFSSPSYFTKCFREEFGYSPNKINID